MFETVKEVDEETVTKENNSYLTRESNDTPLSGNIEYLDEINASFIIKADATKKNQKTERWFNVSIEWPGKYFAW